MRPQLLFAFLMVVAPLAQADLYGGFSLGQGNATARDFRFHNPVGAPFAVPAGTGPYIPLNGVVDEQSRSQWSLRGGYLRDGSPWRFELDFTQRSRYSMSGFANFGPGANFRQDLRIRSNSTLLMGYYDHALDQDWVLYGGFGVGWARNRVDGSQGANLGGTGYFPGASQTSGAWAAAVGLNRKLTERVMLDVGYRYVSLGKANTGTTDASFGALVPFAMNPSERLESQLRSHELRVGVNYRF